MYVARILYPVEVLGPGKRIGIWLAGCPHHCDGCSNPELWEPKLEYQMSVQQVDRFIRSIAMKRSVNGFTITGGEPFAQTESLYQLLLSLMDITEDILVYTGYTLAQLRERRDPATDQILSKIAVLIDGRYEKALNTGAVLRGSSNQCIHILRDAYCEMYEAYLASAVNQIQNFTTHDGIISVGIHRDGFMSALNAEAEQRGILS